MPNIIWLCLAANKILLMRKLKPHVFSSSWLQLLLRENGRSLPFPKIFLNKKNKLCDRMIKQLLKSVIAKYRDLSVSRRSISASANNLSARHWQITIFCSTSSDNCYLFIQIFIRFWLAKIPRIIHHNELTWEMTPIVQQISRLVILNR